MYFQSFHPSSHRSRFHIQFLAHSIYIQFVCYFQVLNSTSNTFLIHLQILHPILNSIPLQTFTQSTCNSFLVQFLPHISRFLPLDPHPISSSDLLILHPILDSIPTQSISKSMLFPNSTPNSFFTSPNIHF